MTIRVYKTIICCKTDEELIKLSYVTKQTTIRLRVYKTIIWCKTDEELIKLPYVTKQMTIRDGPN